MGEIQEFIQTNKLRAQVYRMLSSLYFTELTMDQIKALSEQDFSSFSDLDPEMAEGAKEIARAVRHPHSGTREDLAVDYAHIFLAAGSSKNEIRGVPYESVYTSESGLLMGPARQAVYRIMRRENALPDPSLRVPEDHLSFECDFMTHMADKGVLAAEGGHLDEALRCMEVSQDFRDNHLANWIDIFYKAVDRTARTRFYRGVAMITRSFIRIDEELLGECRRLVEEASQPGSHDEAASAEDGPCLT